MSDALEALERLIREMKRFPRLYELPRFPIPEAEDALANIRAALEQPSTAEAQARALEDAADNLLNQADRMENSVVSQRATRDAAWFLSAEAKRIREEAK